MTRCKQLTKALSPGDEQYDQMLAQRTTATTRHAYLRSVILPWFKQKHHPSGYQYTFYPETLSPVFVHYFDLEIDSRREPARNVYAKEFEKSWKLRERGILHALEDMKKFMTVLEAPYADIIVRGWKTLFHKLSTGNRIAEADVPCLVCYSIVCV